MKSVSDLLVEDDDEPVESEFGIKECENESEL